MARSAGSDRSKSKQAKRSVAEEMQEEVIQEVTALVKAAEPCSTGEGDRVMRPSPSKRA